MATSIIPSSTGWVQSTLNFSCVFFFCCFFFYEKQQKQGCIAQSKNFSGLALNLAISLVLEIHMIALILALHITERKVQRSHQSLYSDCSSHSVDDHWERLQFIFVPYGNHSPAITMIVVIIWKPPLRDKASYKPPTFCTYQLFYNIIPRKPTFCNYSLCTSFLVLWFVLKKDKLLRKWIRFTNKKGTEISFVLRFDSLPR